MVLPETIGPSVTPLTGKIFSPLRVTPSKARSLGPASRVFTHGSSRIRVIVKVRPFLQSECQRENQVPQPCVELGKSTKGKAGTVTVSDKKNRRNDVQFHLDACYDALDSIEAVFSLEVEPILQGIYSGYNATIFAYGATGSGKTHTMQGTIDQPGIMALAVKGILAKMAELGDHCQLVMSYLEVYMDRCYDLLEPKEELAVLDDARGRVSVPELAQVEIKTEEEFQAVFTRGCEKRRTGATGLNDVSSRSHGVLKLELSWQDSDVPQKRSIGKLHLIDLAGNEDNRRTGNEGVRMAESSGINQSLFALSKVIHALNNGGSHVPYRDSKLTRLLRDSLGGSSCSVMIACLNPGAQQEALYTLKLAAKARQVENHHGPNDEGKPGNASVDMKTKLLQWQESKGKIATTPQSIRGGSRRGLLTPASLLQNGAESFPAKAGAKTCSARKENREGIDSKSKGLVEKLELRMKAAGNPPMSLGLPLSFETPHEGTGFGLDVTNTGAHSKWEPDLSRQEAGQAEAAPRADEASKLVALGSEEDEHGKWGIDSSSEEQKAVEATQALPPISISGHLVHGAPIPGATTPLQSGPASGLAVPLSVQLRALGDNLRAAFTPRNLNTQPILLQLTAAGNGSGGRRARGDGLCGNGGTAMEDFQFLGTLCSNESQEDVQKTTVAAARTQPPADEIVASSFGSPFIQTPPSRSHLAAPSETSEQTPLEKTSRGLMGKLEQAYLDMLNTSSEEELQSLKGIGEKRAKSILAMRRITPQPFLEIDDLQKIGLSAKQAKKLFSEEIQKQFAS